LQELKRDIADGAIVAVSTRVGTRVTKEEMIATAMRLWDQSVIEEALGDDAPRLIPEAIRLVELRARVPRYQRDVLRELARRDGTSVDAILTRELDDVARRMPRSWRWCCPTSPQRSRGQACFPEEKRAMPMVI